MQHLQITYLCTSISVWDRCCSSAWHNFFGWLLFLSTTAWLWCWQAQEDSSALLWDKGFNFATHALHILTKKWQSIKSARSTKKPSTRIFVHRKKSFDILNQSANCAQCTHWSQLRCRSDAMMQKFKCQPRHKKKLQKVVLNVCTGQL